jgi:hypothetical protein
MAIDAGFHWLWPTPIGLHGYADAGDLNPLLVRVFGEGRAALEGQRGEQPGPFFASDDEQHLDEWISSGRRPPWRAIADRSR